MRRDKNVSAIRKEGTHVKKKRRVVGFMFVCFFLLLVSLGTFLDAYRILKLFFEDSDPGFLLSSS